MKKLLSYILLILPAYLFGQEQPIYNHFYINPYVYNPAYAGSHGYTVAYANFRNQWSEIEGAPTTYTLTIDAPLKKGVSLGANIFSDERGFITTNSGQLTFGYRVPFSKETGLNFGISGGAGTNNIDFSQLPDDAIEDPVIQNILENNFFVNARFGLNFDLNNIHFGFVLPNLIKSPLFSTQEFAEFEFDALSQYMVMGKVKLDFSPTTYLQPFVIYKQLIDGQPQFEGVLTLHLKNTVWIGGSYRQGYGPSGIFGLQAKDVFTMAYSYELAEKQSSSIGGGTHEIQISLRLGKNKKKEEEDKPRSPNVVATTYPPVEEDPVEEDPVEEPVEEPETTTETVNEPERRPTPEEEQPTETQKDPVTPIIIPSHRQEPEVKEAPKKKDAPVVFRKGSHEDELHVGHYVIVGAFGQKSNAERAASEMRRNGENAEIGYVSEKNRYYIYISKSQSASEARRVRDKVRGSGEFPSAWYLLMQEESIKEVDYIPPTPAPQAKVETDHTPKETKQTTAAVAAPIIIPATKDNPPAEVEREVEREAAKPQPATQEPAVEETPKTETVVVIPKKETTDPQPTKKEDVPVIVRRGKHPLELAEGHYVIVGAFGSLKNAEKLSDQMFNEGFRASFGYVSEKQLFYVYLSKTISSSSARRERDRLRKFPEFSKAWYLLVQE